MAMARRVSLFTRDVSVKLSAVAVELVHDVARVLSEGAFDGDIYAGSTMLTVDLTRTANRISDPPDASTAQKVAFLYAADERCRDRARRVAAAEARKVAACELLAPHIDVESRAKGSEVHLSLNVEARRQP